MEVVAKLFFLVMLFFLPLGILAALRFVIPAQIVSKIWRPILFGTIATVMCALVGAFLSAGGHNFALMMVFFPWAMMITGFLGPLSGWFPFVLLIALQFPLYGIVVACLSTPRLFRVMVGLVVLIHSLGITCCFVLDREESWRILFNWT